MWKTLTSNAFGIRFKSFKKYGTRGLWHWSTLQGARRLDLLRRSTTGILRPTSGSPEYVRAAWASVAQDSGSSGCHTTPRVTQLETDPLTFRMSLPDSFLSSFKGAPLPHKLRSAPSIPGLENPRRAHTHGPCPTAVMGQGGGGHYRDAAPEREEGWPCVGPTITYGSPLGALLTHMLLGAQSRYLSPPRSHSSNPWV